MSPFEPLTRDQVASVIEGRSTAPRVPANIHMWVHREAFGEREQAVGDLLRGQGPLSQQGDLVTGLRLTPKVIER